MKYKDLRIEVLREIAMEMRHFINECNDKVDKVCREHGTALSNGLKFLSPQDEYGQLWWFYTHLGDKANDLTKDIMEMIEMTKLIQEQGEWEKERAKKDESR